MKAGYNEIVYQRTLSFCPAEIFYALLPNEFVTLAAS